MRAALWATSVVLCACRPTGGDTATTDVALPEAWEYQGEEDEVVWDLDHVGASVESAIGWLDQVPSRPLLDAHATALSWRDDVCPHVATSGPYGQWLGICTTEDENRFSGGVFFYDVTDDDLSGAEGFWVPNDSKIPEGTLYTGSVWHGQAYIRGADGADFLASGLLADLTGVMTDGGEIALHYVSGQFLWTGEGAEESWLSTGTWPYFGLHRFSWPDSGARATRLDGSISFDDGAGVEAVTFDAITLADGAFDSDCALEPRRTVSWRDPSGRWLTVAFDVSGEEPTEEGACDGCGRAWHGEELVGDVCVDFSGLYGG